MNQIFFTKFPNYNKRGVRIRQAMQTIIIFSNIVGMPTICPMPTIFIIKWHWRFQLLNIKWWRQFYINSCIHIFHSLSKIVHFFSLNIREKKNNSGWMPTYAHLFDSIAFRTSNLKLFLWDKVMEKIIPRNLLQIIIA